MSDMRKLWQLQMLEEQQNKLKDRGSDPELVKQLRMLKGAIEAGQNQLKELKNRYDGAGEQVNHLAKRAQEIKDKINSINEKIYDGSLQVKEIGTYQQRLEKLKNEMLELEDRQLDQMQQREDIKQQWQQLQNGYKEDKEKFKELHRRYTQAKEELKTQTQSFEGETQAVLSSIEGHLLKEYRRLKERFANPVGRVSKDTCTGCHLSVTFEKIKQLRHGQPPVFCSNCGRLLYWDPGSKS